MQIAIFSDIHGNSIALDALLEDLKSQEPIDAYWLLGDYAAIGFDPVGCLERIAQLPNAVFTRGNTDRIIVEGLSPRPGLDDLPKDVSELRQVFEEYLSFTWTQGAVTSAGWLDWLAALPLEHRETLPDGTRFLGVHASPGRDDSAGLHPDQDEAELSQLFGKSQADLVCVGHTHIDMDLEFGSMRLVNQGSVSNPNPPELRASYVLLDADAKGYKLAHHFVDYDRQAVIDEVNRVQHPAADYIIAYMRGENRPFWENE